jgi:hypothetical protein
VAAPLNQPAFCTFRFISVLILTIFLLSACSRKPPITTKTPALDVVKYLSWHLRANLGEFNRFATKLNKIDHFPHFRHQTAEAVNGLLAAGIWRKDSVTHTLYQQFGSTLTSLYIISVLKKGDSLVFHMNQTDVNNINSQFNLVYNTSGQLKSGFVSNTRSDRAPCEAQYLTTQYHSMSMGSCYRPLTDGWYLHHAYQHINGKAPDYAK